MYMGLRGAVGRGGSQQLTRRLVHFPCEKRGVGDHPLLGVAATTCNPSTWEVEAGDQPWLSTEGV